MEYSHHQPNHKNLYELYRQDIRSTLELSYPIVVAQIGLVMMGVTDNLMVGGLGASPLAAAGIANAIFFFVAVVGIGVLSIVSPLVAAARSQQNYERCSLLLTNSIRIATWVALFSIGLIFLASYHFYLFKQEPEVEALTIRYLNLLGISVWPMFIFLAVKSFSDGLSLTKPAMHVSFVCFFLNILLNWVLIYGKWGLPALGLEGAGIATLLSRVLMAVGVVLYVFKSNKIRAYLPNFSLKNYHKEISYKILQLGLPAGMQYVFEVGAFAGASIMIGWLGTNQLAAHQIGINLASVTYMIAAGFAAAGSIKVGDAWGERSREKVLRFGTTAIILTGAFMSLSCLIFITGNEFLVHLYIDEGEVVQIAASLLIIAGFFQLSDGVQCVALGALRGLEDVNIPTIITLFAYWVVGLPLGYYLAFNLKMDVDGVWFGLSAGLTISAIFQTSRFYLLTRQKKFAKKQAKGDRQQAKIEIL